MSKRLIMRLTAGIICGLIVLAAAAVWIDSSRRTAPLKPGTFAGEQWVGNSLNIPFRWCLPGNFMMGSPPTEPNRNDDEDQVPVALTHGFWLGQTEVTQGQWQGVMGTAPWKGHGWVSEGPNYPATHVRHSGDADSAVEFCTRFTSRERAAGRLPAGWEYRLPTEAEWEYACRAGTTTVYSYGDDAAQLGRHAWFGGNGKLALSGTESWLADHALYAHPVGTKQPNVWGLHDMHGSVQEWCADWHATKLRRGADPRGLEGSRRVLRGSGWTASFSDCRSACRGRIEPSYHDPYLGLRLALSPVR